MVNVDRIATLWSYGLLFTDLASAGHTAVVGGGGMSDFEQADRAGVVRLDFCGFARVGRTTIVRGDGGVQGPMIWSMASWKDSLRTWTKKSMALPWRLRRKGKGSHLNN